MRSARSRARLKPNRGSAALEHEPDRLRVMGMRGDWRRKSPPGLPKDGRGPSTFGDEKRRSAAGGFWGDAKRGLTATPNTTSRLRRCGAWARPVAGDGSARRVETKIATAPTEGRKGAKYVRGGGTPLRGWRFLGRCETRAHAHA